MIRLLRAFQISARWFDNAPRTFLASFPSAIDRSSGSSGGDGNADQFHQINLPPIWNGGIYELINFRASRTLCYWPAARSLLPAAWMGKVRNIIGSMKEWIRGYAYIYTQKTNTEKNRKQKMAGNQSIINGWTSMCILSVWFRTQCATHFRLRCHHRTPFKQLQIRFNWNEKENLFSKILGRPYNTNLCACGAWTRQKWMQIMCIY